MVILILLFYLKTPTEINYVAVMIFKSDTISLREMAAYKRMIFKMKRLKTAMILLLPMNVTFVHHQVGNLCQRDGGWVFWSVVEQNAMLQIFDYEGLYGMTLKCVVAAIYPTLKIRGYKLWKTGD